jgi:hypothetical protein
VVGIFPNEVASTRLFGAILMEQNDQRAVQRARYRALETIAPIRDDPIISLPVTASCAFRPSRASTQASASYTTYRDTISAASWRRYWSGDPQKAPKPKRK